MPATDPISPGRRFRWLLLAAALGLLLLGAAWLGRAPLLRAAADAWIVDEPPGRADAIAVLGGGAQYRTFEAARLYHAGVAPRIAYLDVALSPYETNGLALSETDTMRRVLEHQRIPAGGLVQVGRGVTSTSDEALALREWAVRSGVRSLVVPTDLFHTRRVRRHFGKIFAGTGIDLRVCAITPEEYSRHDWWRHEEGVLMFQNELIKSVLYLLRR